jgi:hypothetical protein
VSSYRLRLPVHAGASPIWSSSDGIDNTWTRSADGRWTFAITTAVLDEDLGGSDDLAASTRRTKIRAGTGFAGAST